MIRSHLAERACSGLSWLSNTDAELLTLTDPSRRAEKAGLEMGIYCEYYILYVSGGRSIENAQAQASSLKCTEPENPTICRARWVQTG